MYFVTRSMLVLLHCQQPWLFGGSFRDDKTSIAFQYLLSCHTLSFSRRQQIFLMNTNMSSSLMFSEVGVWCPYPPTLLQFSQRLLKEERRFSLWAMSLVWHSKRNLVGWLHVTLPFKALPVPVKSVLLVQKRIKQTRNFRHGCKYIKICEITSAFSIVCVLNYLLDLVLLTCVMIIKRLFKIWLTIINSYGIFFSHYFYSSRKMMIFKNFSSRLVCLSQFRRHK